MSLAAVFWFMAASTLAFAASSSFVGLPQGARIVEVAQIPSAIQPNRAIVLWMVGPKDRPRAYSAVDEPYTCPEFSRGWHWRGPTRLSLVDTNTKQVINTIRVRTGNAAKPFDSFDIPYWIEAGRFYQVPGATEGQEGKPTLLAFQDLTGDGRALEFSLYDMQACIGPDTYVFGYSVGRDRVIHYQFYWTEPRVETSWYVDRLVNKLPVEPGRWRFRLKYNTGTSCLYDFRFVPGRERFEGVQCSEQE